MVIMSKLQVRSKKLEEARDLSDRLDRRLGWHGHSLLRLAVALVEQFLDHHLNNRGRRHSEDRAENAQDGTADEQSDQHRHSADANLPLHHFGDQQMVLDLLL